MAECDTKGRKRRDAIRAAWMQDPLVTTSVVVVCFLLSFSFFRQNFLSALRCFASGESSESLENRFNANGF